jgi:hypothetical protein
VLAAGRGQLDQLGQEMEMRAAEGWESRAASAPTKRSHTFRAGSSRSSRSARLASSRWK